ncbi:MAG: family 43 glycosylhydrolase [Eubacterium sp.]|nr:family 43 glycosylhydrolase [Eubacterium sp.]
MKNTKTKRLLALGLASAMALSSIYMTEGTIGAASKAVKKVILKIGKKKVTKKTYKLKVKKTAKLKVTVRPASAKKSVTFKSKKKSVATVNKKGKIKAKKAGTAKIIVTVTGKNGKKNKTWVKIKVQKASSSTQSTTTATSTPSATATPAASQTPDPNAVYTPGPTRTPSKTYVANVNPINQCLYASGNAYYGGDPSVLVDGDTVYLYVGHDTSVGDSYNIIDWSVYASKDLKTWNYHGPVLSMKNISWASDSISAWAAQVAERNGRYYLYYCTADRNCSSKKSIGVAVADNPTGPFEDIGQALVSADVTLPQTSDWNDIDPTVWIENDAQGVEHRYLAWGNGNLYVCELNADMISVKDQNGDGQITGTKEDGTAVKSTADGDVISLATPSEFTEAPWLYRRQDSQGNYYGPYYLFYAKGWREQMAYATSDDLMNGKFTYQGTLTGPTATSNTNHMAVFDFNGKTYWVYHNGALKGGSGFRRCANITEMTFNEDGSINPIPETAAGINGIISRIYGEGGFVYHANFTNSTSDGSYPYTNIALGNDTTVNGQAQDGDSQWVLVPGKADTSAEDLISFQSENKPGLYIHATDKENLVLAQDYVYKNKVAVSEAGKAMTFKIKSALNGISNKYSFESYVYEGYYMTLGSDGKLCLTDGSDKDAATFSVESFTQDEKIVESLADAVAYNGGSIVDSDTISQEVEFYSFYKELQNSFR